MSATKRALLAATLLSVGAPASAAAADAGVDSSRYVLIVGNNRSIDPEVPSLHYADDDAVLYMRLLEPYAARLELLTVLDDPSQERHPGVAGRTRLPTRKQLRDSLARLYTAIEQDPGDTELLFVFIGHGSVDDQGRGYVHLQDGPFTRADLFAEVIAKSPADFTHIIIDACNAFSLVGGRGAKEKDTVDLDALFKSFLAGHQLENYPSVGVLAATSENRETHEWSRIGAGVFSYQVRSALSGAADINRDGRVEYSEIAAFVDAANAGLPSVGKRLSTFAWPPLRDRRRPLLTTGRREGMRKIELRGDVTGRYFLESEQGERWAELHSSAPVTLAVPANTGFYLRTGSRNGSANSYETFIEAGTNDVIITDVPTQSYTLTTRGAVDRAFERGLFAVPFSRDYYRGYVSGRSQFIQVEIDAPELGISSSNSITDSNADTGFAIAAHHTLGISPIARGSIEQGGQVRIEIALGEFVSIAPSVEGAYASVRPGVGVARFTAYVGASLHRTWLDRITVSVGLDVGYAIIAIDAQPSSVDFSVASVRARTGLEVRLLDSLWLSLGATYSVYLADTDTNDTVHQSPLGYSGFVWR